MKKILTALFSGILILVFVLILNVYNFSYFENVLYTGKTAISIVLSEQTTEKQVQNIIDIICKKYEINFSKYIFHNKADISIFTSDPTAYITSKKTDTYDHLILPLNNMNIRVMPIDKLSTSSGYGGIYYIDSTDKNIIDNIISELNKTVGSTEIHSYYATNNNKLGNYIQNISLIIPIFSLIVVSCLIVFFIIVKIAVFENKTIAILHLNGYTNHRIFTYLAYKYKESFIFSFLFSTIFIVATMMLKGNLCFLSNLFFFNTVIFILIALLLGIIFFVTIKFIDMQNRKIDIIRGNTVHKTLLIFQFLLKYILLILVVLLFISLSDYQHDINIYKNSNGSWLKTENIHKVKAKFVTNDLEEKRKLEFRAKELYHDLEINHKAFLIDTRNFDVLSSGEYIWKENAKSGAIYSSQGKSITVNINYLKRNTIVDVKGTDVLNKVIVDDYVRNILVPISLKEDEDIIIEKFLEDFIFQKVKVPQIYQSEIGEEIIPVDIQKLSVNLIYISEHTDFFTYNKDIMPDKSNIITDPIVIVDTGNIDASFYFSRLTHSVFLESDSPEPFFDIYKDIKSHNLLSVFSSLEPIYNTRAEEMQSLIKASNATAFTMIIIIFLLIFFMYILSHTYFEHNKYNIFVKYFSGYSLFKIYKIKLLTEIILDIIILYFSKNTLFFISIITIDIFCTCIFSIKFYNSAALNIIKKGDI